MAECRWGRDGVVVGEWEAAPFLSLFRAGWLAKAVRAVCTASADLGSRGRDDRRAKRHLDQAEPGPVHVIRTSSTPRLCCEISSPSSDASHVQPHAVCVAEGSGRQGLPVTVWLPAETEPRGEEKDRRRELGVHSSVLRTKARKLARARRGWKVCMACRDV